MVAHEPEVKSGWPITIDAASSVENGVLNLKTLLLPASATHRFPALSKVNQTEPHRPVFVGGLDTQVEVVKSGWPITNEADSPLTKYAYETAMPVDPRNRNRIPHTARNRAV